MSNKTLEERVAAMEKQLDALLANGARKPRAKDWRRTLGAFTGVNLMKQVFAEGRKIRAAERRAVRPRIAKGRQASS
jgi:hypothetical protein